MIYHKQVGNDVETDLSGASERGERGWGGDQIVCLSLTRAPEQQALTSNDNYTGKGWYEGRI